MSEQTALTPQQTQALADAQAIPPGSASGAPEPPRMPFLAHLGELRRRLIYALVALTATSALAFAYAPELFELLRMPLAAVPGAKMIVLSPLEMFTTYMKLALLVGFLSSSPIILLQLWLFVAPGLYPSERRWAIPFIVTGSGCFIGGAAFCFFAVLPASFTYLVDMVPHSVEAHYSVSLYFTLVVQLMLSFGGIFELPLVMTLLGAAGIVTAEKYAAFRKYWAILAMVIGGIVTPTPDPMTQVMMAVPLMVFYEMGIVGTRLVRARTRVGR